MTTKLNKAHRIFLFILIAIFTVLTFMITNAGVDDGPGHNSAVLYSTMGTIAGPLTGAISRDFQGCCLKFSLLLMAFCAPILLVAIAIQFIRMPDYKWIPAMRLVSWVVGWTCWFLAGILSFGHALS